MDRRLLAAAAALLVAGCYAPETRDCALRCGPEGSCADGLTCGAGGFCRTPGSTGTCSAAGGDAGANATDAGGPSFALTVGLTGAGSGRIASDPAGIDCPGACVARFDPGELVTLTATADEASSRFTGWDYGTCNRADVCEVDVSEDLEVGGQFELRSFRVSIGIVGNGRVRSDELAVNCTSDCAERAPYGTEVTLTATGRGAAWNFDRWTGACAGQGATCTVTITAATAVRAVFVN